MKITLLILGMLALLAAPSGHDVKADELKLYYKGDSIQFTSFRNRIVCRNHDTVRDVLVKLRSDFAGRTNQLKELIWRPVEWHLGRPQVDATIQQRSPDSARMINENCATVPAEEVVLLEHWYTVRLGEYDLIVATVADTNRNVYATYFVNVGIRTPLPGSQKHERFIQVLKAVLQQ